MASSSTQTTSEQAAAEALLTAQAVVSQVTQQDIARALRDGRWNMKTFAKDVLGIEPHAGQEAMFELALSRDSDGFTPTYLTVCASAGNRAGKTLGLAIIVAHQTLYKMGIRQPDAGDDASLNGWTQAPFDWYHFGISQEVAELLHLELQRILTGVHEAQKGRGCPLTEALGQDVADWDKKERGEWAWFKWSPLLGGAEIHFRTTGEKALSTLGRDMNGWSWDEPAFDPNLIFVFDEVLNLRRMSTGGQAFLIATATEGSYDYEMLWKRGDPLAPDREPDYASVRISSRDNVGYGIPQKMFDRMLRTVPPSLVPQNIDGYFIEARSAYFATDSVNRAFVPGMPEFQEAYPTRIYVQGVDPAITYDSTWSVVLDITDPDHWVGVYCAKKSGRQTAESVVALTSDTHHRFATVGRGMTTGIDATGMGGKVFQSLLRTAKTPVTSVEFGGRSSTKQKLLANTRTALDSGRLVFPETGLWLQLRRQMLSYKLVDKKLETDALMALVVAVKMAARRLYGEGKSVPFDYFGTPLASVPSKRVVSEPEAPRRYVDDRVSRLDTLATATVAPLSGVFKR